jgi:hypothetical protein
LRFRAREREAKREREEKKSAKKGKAPSAKEKNANLRFFLPPTVESGFRAQSRSAGGEARVLSNMYSSVGMLKRQRGKDTGEETQGKRHRGET